MNYKAEQIRPYNDEESKTGQVRQMFDSIAPAYDFMNRAMTFGIDRWWRKRAVKMVGEYCPKNILDVATGTGDLALQLFDTLHPEHITGVDLSEGMLEIGRKKVADKGLSSSITLEQGDCLAMSYPDNTFNAVTVAYGVRNFEHLQQGYAEMYRVLDNGGVLCVIELSVPVNPVIRALYNLYTHILVPMVGRLVSKDRRAYSYLPESIAAVAQGEEMLEIMRKAGFKKCRYKRMTFGTCTIYIGEKA